MHQKRKGLLIVIDGADGSGKLTQTELLVERLRSEGQNVVSFSFPQYERFFGAAIALYLEGRFGRPQDINPRLSSLLYALDRFSVKDEIQDHLDASHVVVLNRYVESNMAYQGAKVPTGEQRQEFLGWLEELEFSQLGIPRADLVIYLSVPVEVSQGLLKDRLEAGQGDGATKDEHEKDVEYLRSVAEVYLELAKERRWAVVDCAPQGTIMARETIHEMIWELVSGVVFSASDI